MRSVLTDLPESNVESCHVVSDVAVEVDEHVPGFSHHLRHLLDGVAVVPDQTGEDSRQVGEHLRRFEQF